MFLRCTRCYKAAFNGCRSPAARSTKPLHRHVQSFLIQTNSSRLYATNAENVTKVDRGFRGTDILKRVSELELVDTELRESKDGQTVENERAQDVEELAEEDTTSEVPWYLQEDEDIVPETSLAQRQQLPDIPTDAPEKLQEVIERLSTDIGLDSLQLIDLRSLDPPPALGANVIMVVGTARSEKHLHVSADRFARWLRSAHKLDPHTDGLLGRNQLKLRLKRRARRAKLLSSVGAMPKLNEDDGTRVEWICVDAGVLDPRHQAEQSLDDSGIIGFGSSTDGTKLVVQMVTEDKRRELDLETLWARAFERQSRRRASANIEAEAEDYESAQDSPKSIGL